MIKDPDQALRFTAEQVAQVSSRDTWVIPQSGGKVAHITIGLSMGG